MCGIGGILSKKNFPVAKLERINSIQQHRGPDHSSYCKIELNDWFIGLAHQRLAILDLTDAGNQPMSTSNGNSTIIYNGEVYNYKELQQELEQIANLNLKGHSDTEIILHAIDEWGIDAAIKKFNGMWAFAFLDKRSNKLYLCRDRVGEKPLYYYLHDNELYFASEIKSLLQVADKKFKLNLNKVGQYLEQSLLDSSDDTFFAEIKKIPPAHYAEIDLAKRDIEIKFKRYWTAPNIIESYKESTAIEELKHLFIDSVNLRMRSDVPVGGLLSGGLDSSSVASAMRLSLQNKENLHLISAVSPNSIFDESEHMDKMAVYLNSPINKVRLDQNTDNMLSLLEKITWHNDEPVGSFSNVAHFLLMKQAKELGTVVILGGQGADELFCGYKKYLGFYLISLMKNKNYVKGLKTFAEFYNNKTIINQFSMKEAKRYLPARFNKNVSILGEQLQQYQKEVVGLGDNNSIIARQLADIEKFSIPVLTHYEDRMSMAYSREIRQPFLDHRLIDFALKLPVEMKLKNGWTKWIFRKAMEDMLPAEITWRKDKQGFVTPQEDWMKEELKQEIMDKFFCEDAFIFQQGFIDRKLLLDKFKAFSTGTAKGKKVWFKEIFNPLALEIWFRTFKDYIA
jgi:asparagine synthase (glutamine-hydrolysing)